MKRIVKTAAGVVTLAATLMFIVYTFYSLAHPPRAVPAAPLEEVPVKVYGFVEPAGGEIFLSVPQSKRIATLSVREGDRVSKGQEILALESTVEAAQLKVALARVEIFRKTVMLSADELTRTKALFEGKGAAEYDYVSARLRNEINEANLAAAAREAELARATMEDLILRSPVDGIVYKLDVRLGETIVPDDRARIIVGPAELNVRLFVESFWIGRIERDASLDVFDMETNEPVGAGRIVSLSRYLGAKRLRTEDPFERLDTKYQEVIVSLEPKRENIPIGLPVYVTFRK
jgi:HlyD family secretion protein